MTQRRSSPVILRQTFGVGTVIEHAPDMPDGRHEIYKDFRQGYGDQAVRELAKSAKELLANNETDLGTLWLNESKADWVIADKGVRFRFKDFWGWAASLS